MTGPRRGPDGRVTSYAQCGEDIPLLRVFGNQPSGCWIDIGANHPVRDSVTKNFSEMGWTGINVEPVVSLYEDLVADRPADVNVLAGISDTAGQLIFHRNDSNLDLSTFDSGLAATYRDRGDVITDTPVEVMTSTELCERYLGDRRIDFMKVDTEGHELAVLAGHDFERFPVRVLLAEGGAHRATIAEQMAKAGMQLVLFDGNNIWFTSVDEDPEFVDLLARPATPVIDWYHPQIYLTMLQQKDDYIASLHGRIEQLEQEQSAAATAGAPAAAAPTLARQARSLAGRLRRAVKSRLR